MKTNVLSVFVIVFLLASCGGKDKKQQLEELKVERDKLIDQIAELEKEINAEGDSTNMIHKKQTLVMLDTIHAVEFKHYIEVQGYTESDNNIFVPAETQGIVERIYVKEGDKVTKGQLLAELDGSIYEKGIEELQTALDLATDIYERQKRLWEQKIGSEIQYLQAKNSKESLEKKLETTKEQYALTKITSPISGTIDEIAIKEGEAAVPGIGAIRVVQLSSLKIEAALSESYVNDVKKGDIVNVTFPSIDYSFEQKITAVSQVINPDNRTFTIEVKVPSKIQAVKPNMLAVLEVNDFTEAEAIVLPISMVQNSGEDHFIFVAEKQDENWIATRRIVETGKYYDNQIHILDGLQEGDVIVSTGFQNLANGQQIEVSE